MEKNKSTKLILVDVNCVLYIVVFSKYLVEKYKGMRTEYLTNEKLEELIRDTLKMFSQKIFNILTYNQDFSLDIVFAKDGFNLWRKEQLFPAYKEHRKVARAKSSVDFKLVFKIFEKVWDELKEVFPFRFVRLEHIEADDIIAETILSEMDKYDKFQIYSTDSDLIQLLRYDKVEVYNPKTTKFAETQEPEYLLFEKIITGDKSDGIPNIYSDSIYDKQRPIFRKRVRNWFDDKNEFRTFLKEQSQEVQKRFIRNKRLIDLRDIPDVIKQEIRTELGKNRNPFDFHKYLKTMTKYHIDVGIEKANLIEEFERGLPK